ncbi:MAG: translation initiation factor IF-2 subunit gamma [Candidatus Bathyarchaeota archaeon]
MVHLPRQPEVNIGTLGHVDNGKSTLVLALSGTWTAKHSEEMKRGITIKVGYADAAFYRCTKCGTYGTSEICANCGSTTKFLRAVSFVDCPGHHSLMVTMLSGAALMDGALLILSAADKCPQPQDREHLAAAQITGIKNIIIVQNKIDIVSRERVLENYKEIKAFIKGTFIEDAPIIPVSAQRGINIDVLIEAIEKYIPSPKRDMTKNPTMSILRSFDVNSPGTQVEELIGGVLGGSILQGVFRAEDDIEIRPGIHVEREGKSYYEPLFSKVISLYAGGKSVKEATCGGLVGMGTLLDPALTKADSLTGSIVGRPGNLPPVLDHLIIETRLLDKMIGTEELQTVEKIKPNEALVLNTGTTVTAGIVTSVRHNTVELNLKRPICLEPKSRLALSRRVANNWRLIGYGILE